MEVDSTRLLSIRETQKILGNIGRTTIYELIKRGHLTKLSIGRRGLITSESINAYIEQLAGQAAGGPELNDAAPSMATSAEMEAAK